ncbi:flagellar motor protein MotB [Albibacillus kandeliae]|uniref:flagellar motor protein MotB n=1 Tax=Albibacillus kandeliae TaxID=2174228 RepID=UPI000D69B2CD|nr:flagellar motor protein MotB [Albibacillus kandeliae]
MTNRPIIIKRVEDEGEAGHHGGGWKVAYADFMTAMMAFFLLLWILAASDEEKLRGLADYFTPSLSEQGGRGDGILNGEVLGPQGVLSGTEGPKSEIQLPSFGQENPLAMFDSRIENQPRAVVEYEPSPEDPRPNADETTETQPNVESTGDQPVPPEMTELAQARELREGQLDALEQEITNAIKQDPTLEDFTANIRFVRTPQGLTVQIIDQEGRSMFSLGSSRIQDHTRELIEIIGQAIAPMTYPVTITGHTDSLPFNRSSGYSNWELSADRANATRRVLVGTGVNPSRLERISGLADTEPLTPEAPDAPQNRRIDILLAYPDPALKLPAPSGP